MEHHEEQYQDRINKGVGKDAEEIFEKHLEGLGLYSPKDWLKVGTSPWEHDIDLFWLYTAIVLVPDYIFNRKGMLYLSEVKGTKRIKATDMENLREMYDKSKDFDKVQVGISYVNVQTKKVKWYSFKQVEEMWNSIDKLEYYHETDFRGQKKAYKILPL